MAAPGQDEVGKNMAAMEAKVQFNVA